MNLLAFVFLTASMVFANPWYGGPVTAVVSQGQGPSAFYLNNDPNQFYTFFFATSRNAVTGQEQPGDDLYTTVNGRSRRLILPRTNWLIADDAQNAAAPSVIQHPNPAPYGMPTFVMYYECAKKLFDRDNPQVRLESYTQICLAGSNDLVNWYKYNSMVGFSNATPTAIITFSDTRKAECGEAVSVDRWVWSLSDPRCGEATRGFDENYGVGHPSAISYPNSALIDLYYIDSMAASPHQMFFRARSWNGIHFFDKQMTNLSGAYTVRYHQPSGTYIATANCGGRNCFYLSSDGLNFNRGPYATIPNFSGVGNVVYDGSIVSDQWGHIHSWNVLFVSSEGTNCIVGPNFSCPNGTTDWFLYLLQGSFFGI